MRKILVILALGALFAVALVGATGGSAIGAPPHRHCMLTPNGYVELAEGALRNNHDQGFHNFHAHVHFGESVPTTIVGLLDLNLTCDSLNTAP